MNKRKRIRLLSMSTNVDCREDATSIFNINKNAKVKIAEMDWSK
jgi:hypothetical protein